MQAPSRVRFPDPSPILSKTRCHTSTQSYCNAPSRPSWPNLPRALTLAVGKVTKVIGQSSIDSGSRVVCLPLSRLSSTGARTVPTPLPPRCSSTPRTMHPRPRCKAWNRESRAIAILGMTTVPKSSPMAPTIRRTAGGPLWLRQAAGQLLLRHRLLRRHLMKANSLLVLGVMALRLRLTPL